MTKYVFIFGVLFGQFVWAGNQNFGSNSNQVQPLQQTAAQQAAAQAAARQTLIDQVNQNNPIPPSAPEVQTIPSDVTNNSIPYSMPSGMVCNSGTFDPSSGNCLYPSGQPVRDASGQIVTPNVAGYTGNTNGNGTASDPSGAQACQTAASSAIATCSSPQGIGGQSAAAIQKAANDAAMMQEMNAANQTNNGGGVTVVNVSNGQPQPANPGANAACNATKIMADANAVSSVVASSFCVAAYNACQAACVTGDGSSTEVKNMGSKMWPRCQAAFHVFESQVIPQALNAVMMQKLGSTCNTALAANPNPIPINAPPTVPPPGDIGNVGYQGNPPSTTAPMAADNSGNGSGGSGLTGGGYPGGPGDKPTQAGTGASQKGYDLTTSNSSGSGMVPFGNNGIGNMPGKGAAPFDIGSLFGKDGGEGDRKPAGLTEVTGANDLTNFQKVTRMMNKKRTTLKSGDGA